jgi:hypothetical protein
MAPPKTATHHGSTKNSHSPWLHQKQPLTMAPPKTGFLTSGAIDVATQNLYGLIVTLRQNATVGHNVAILTEKG